MRFPLKFALTAVLAKGIVAELTHLPQTQPMNNDLNVKYQQIQPEYQIQQQQNQQQQDPTLNQEQIYQYPENLDQQAYDPNNVAYQQYAMQDPVQQYVSSYNPENVGAQGESSNDVPTVIDPYTNYPNQFSDGYPQGGYNPVAYNPAAFNPNQYNPGAFRVQTGYEGYLVPGPPGPAQQKVEIAPREQPSFFKFISGLSPWMSRSTSYLGQSFAFLMGLLGVTVFGGTITTALCTFTPLCTISFALPFALRKSSIRNYAEPFMGEEKAKMLEKAIETFGMLNNEQRAQMVAKSIAADPEIDIKSIPSVEKVGPSEKIAKVDSSEKMVKADPSEKMENSEKSDIPVTPVVASEF